MSQSAADNGTGESCIIPVGDDRVNGLVTLPERVDALFCMAHGAGAGMTHPFMERMARALYHHHIGSLRYQFPYMEKRSKRPDPKPVLIRTVVAACRFASGLSPATPLFAGGKSMGGRMTSHAAADRHLDGIKGLIFLGFPLHPPGKPSTERADHLHRVRQPMLFLQGTRDKLADLTLLQPVCSELGSAVTLHVMEGADHSFGYLKNQKPADVYDDLAAVVAKWMKSLMNQS